MEGPSLIILREEAAKFVGKRVVASEGTVGTIDVAALKGQKLKALDSWGKHFLMCFDRSIVRIHFLMFGSYWIDTAHPEKAPKLSLKFANGVMHFYSCSVRELAEEPADIYDWRVDIMAGAWDEKHVLRLLSAKPSVMVCDALLDQAMFAGSGNIIKNEVLFNRKLRPEVRVGALTIAEQRALVREVRAYGQQFYEWKKAYVLRKNWRIFRRRYCAVCESAAVKKHTGTLERVSYYCPRCQPARRGVPRAK